MAYNSDGYIMIDFTEVDFKRTNQTIDGLYKRCVDVIGTNKFILVINANGRTPLPATCSFTNNQYVIDTCIYMFAISSNDNLFIRRNDVPASDIIDDDSVSVDKAWSSNKIDTELKMLAPIDTIINNPVKFKTSLALPLIACKVSCSATQSGSGDPSPSNVRPIHGFSEVNVTANNVVYTIQLGQEVYGGVLDVVSGKLVITHGRKILDGVNYAFNGVWGQTTYGYSVYATVSDGNRSKSTIAFCDKFKKELNTPYMYMPVYTFYGSSGKGNTITFTLPNTITSKEEANAWLVDNNVDFTYPLNKPFDIQLTPTQIETLIGDNTIFADTGTLTVSYKALPIDLL